MLLLVTPVLFECSSSGAHATDADAATTDDATASDAGTPDAIGTTVDGESTDPAWAPILDGGIASANAFAVPVYINHSYRIVPAATFAAFGTSKWLNEEFAYVEQRTTDTGDSGTGSYTGAYPTFERTYLELLVAGTFGSAVGVSGIGLGDETPSGNDKVAQAFTSSFGPANVVTATRTHVVDGGTVPWFHITSLTVWQQIAAWDMEYVTPEGASTPPTRKEDRAHFYDAKKLARNVVALKYALTATDEQLLAQALTVVGWDVISDGASLIAHSPDDNGVKRSIFVIPATATMAGLVMVGFSLNRIPEYRKEVLGDATLTVGANGLPLGELWFVPPP